MIAEYGFYRDRYFGEILTEENFPKYASRADVWLDELTLGRYERDDLPEKAVLAVKTAECAIAELCVTLEQAELRSDAAWAVESEKVGNHAVSYRDSGQLREQTAGQIRRTAERLLGRWGLLSRGIPVCGC